MQRRRFIATSAFAASTAAAGAASEKPALLGGPPVRTQRFSSWPLVRASDEAGLRKTLLSGKWNCNGGPATPAFEQLWAQRLGAKHCLAAANGTTSLIIALNALGIGPGDEVILPPYTFVATVNAVLLQHALPVFVDTDIETFQIDARKIDAAVTDRTMCIMPVHIGGSAADMDTVLAVSKKRNIPVIEDACQAHLGEWRGRKLSTLGQLGCFSFQASKNLNSGEGGAVMTSDDTLIERCRAFHNNGRGFHKTSFEYSGTGCNLRITEFQSSLLTSQLEQLEPHTKTREANASYLTALLKEIPGITPARMYEGCTRNAYHLYMFRYDSRAFANLPRAKFLKALSAEGIPCSSGYGQLNHEPFLKSAMETRGWKRIYSDSEMRNWRERNETPANARLCAEAVWFTQTMLLGGKSDMDQIAEAIRKIQRNAPALLA